MWCGMVFFIFSIARTLNSAKACTTPLIFGVELPGARGLCEYTRHFVVRCYNHIREAGRL